MRIRRRIEGSETGKALALSKGDLDGLVAWTVTLFGKTSLDMKSHKCGYGLDHASDAAPGTLIAPFQGENELSVGSSGISGKIKRQCVGLKAKAQLSVGARVKERGRQ
jgi:hypothetical protein